MWPTIDELEELLRGDPGSESVLSELVSAYYSPELIASERRFELIEEFVRRFPRNIIAQCPFAHVDPLRSRALGSGEVRTRAELARREGVSRARVTQVLRRLR